MRMHTLVYIAVKVMIAVTMLLVLGGFYVYYSTTGGEFQPVSIKDFLLAFLVTDYLLLNIIYLTTEPEDLKEV